jgi:hypothetical protein
MRSIVKRAESRITRRSWSDIEGGTSVTRTTHRLTLTIVLVAAVVAPAPGAQTTPQGATSSQTAAPQGAAAAQHSGAMVLLDRIEALVDEALTGKPAASSSPIDVGATPGAVGTSGSTTASTPRANASKSSAGRVSIDRAKLDEIRAEVVQLKIMLQK